MVASGAMLTEVGGENIVEKVVALVVGSDETISIQETLLLGMESDADSSEDVGIDTRE